MKTLEERIKKALSSGSKYVDECVKHATANRGKRIRPLFLFLTGKACGALTDAHIDAAAAIELFHTATLLHDDVIDESSTRRGSPTHNAKFGNETAVIFGDYMLTCALRAASTDELLKCRDLIVEAARNICVGEMDQISNRYNVSLTEKEYIDMIDKKTATLFAVSCRIGAILSGADEIAQKRVYAFGRNAGIAFQIIDDLLDIYGDEKESGKSLRSDLNKGELTLPFIRLLREERGKESFKKMMLAGHAELSSAKLRDLLDMSDSLNYSISEALRYAESARAFLGCLDASPAKEALLAAADGIVDLQRIYFPKKGLIKVHV